MGPNNHFETGQSSIHPDHSSFSFFQSLSSNSSNSANGIRTRVWALRGPRPSPLDDSAVFNPQPSIINPANTISKHCAVARLNLHFRAPYAMLVAPSSDRLSTEAYLPEMRIDALR
jgi:hypothetical protein